MEGDYGVNNNPVSDLSLAGSKQLNETTTNESEEVQNIRNRIKDTIGKETYNSWFAKVQIKIEEGREINFIAPTKFHKTWIINNYCDQMSEVIFSIYNKHLNINVSNI